MAIINHLSPLYLTGSIVLQFFLLHLIGQLTENNNRDLSREIARGAFINVRLI